MKKNSHYALSISDLIMGFLFIFILILMKFMLEYQNKKENLFQPLEERGKLLEKLKKEMKKKNIQVEIDKENGVLKLSGTHYFNKGQYSLSDTGKNTFQKIKKIFNKLICYSDLEHKKTKKRWPSSKGIDKKSNLKRWQIYCKNKYPKNLPLIDSILIEGHADSTPISQYSKGIKTNLDLAVKRSQTVFVFLLDYKEEHKKYDPVKGPIHTKESGNHLYALVNKHGKPLFGVTSYGNLRRSEPLKKKEDQKKSDRRIDIRFIMSQPEDLSEQLKKPLKSD